MKTYETPEWIAEQSYKNGYEKGYEDGKRDAVKNGRWVKLGKHDWACSACKIGVPYSYTGHHYCPNCGADMRGADHE